MSTTMSATAIVPSADKPFDGLEAQADVSAYQISLRDGVNIRSGEERKQFIENTARNYNVSVSTLVEILGIP